VVADGNVRRTAQRCPVKPFAWQVAAFLLLFCR
jgi:hypothetical protein